MPWSWTLPSPYPDPGARMTTVLPSLALALLCLLRAGAEVPVQLDFNMGKFAGRWHIAAAISNCPVFLSMKDKMKSSIATISFTPEGHLAMEAIFPLPEECKKVKLLFQKSGQAGHYTSTENQEKTDLCVMETDYQHYAIVYTLRDRGQEPSTMLQLYTRKQDVSPQLLQKFKELSHSVGLTEDMLAILPQSDQCTKALA
ncbi:extracellular fatty acid-binding protein-like [Cygnus atratus]|uniref:extracellular fatty acid-binding protein-like n=1 Tax=Cygnus atratus TaxID=8868 RepID=UPI0021B7E098|nr:extracellular fatty acid-binding protein-like [Cygnus atratus]